MESQNRQEQTLLGGGSPKAAPELENPSLGGALGILVWVSIPIVLQLVLGYF